MRWSLRAVAATLGLGEPSVPDRDLTGVHTDTRAMPAGALFVALAGDRFDGHDFLSAARDAGAAGAVVREGTPDVEGLVLFRVPDTLAALGRLATARRRTIAGPVVAITGTNGKTATKELVAAALATRWRTHATRANLNNEIGVPLTILEAPSDTEALVVEAGASVPGEIDRLRRVIEPTAALVTNVSAGHTEGFGDLDGVLAEKASLLAGVPLAVVGTEPDALATRARTAAGTVIVAGLDPGADVRPDAGCTIDADGRPAFAYQGTTFRLPLPGRHQAANAMLALALAERLGLRLDRVAEALAGVALPGGRWEVHRAGDRMVVHDAYNANPGSMYAAFETLESMRAGRPVAVLLGTMLELGTAAAAAHADVAAAALRLEPVLVGAVGAFVPAFAPHAAALGARLVTAPDGDALGRAVAGRLPPRAVVLLKASHGVHLERALPHLLASEAPCSTTS